MLVKAVLEKTKKIPARTKISDDESSGILYILDKTVHFGSFELDLGDKTQYQFVKDSLQRAGETPEKSPMTFKLLDAAFNKGRKMKPGLPKLEKIYIDGKATDKIVPMQWITSFTHDGSKFKSVAFSSYPGGTIRTSIIQNIIAMDADKIVSLNTQITTQFIKGEKLQSTFDAVLPTGKWNEAVSLACFLIFPSDGGVKGFTVYRKHPGLKEGVEESNDQNGVLKFSPPGGEAAWDHVLDAPCHIKTAEPDPIRIAYGNRRSANDDYQYDDSIPANFNIPLKGHLSFMKNIFLDGVSPTGMVRVSLIYPTGGGYVLYATTPSVRDVIQKLADFTVAPADLTTVSWDFSNAAFPREGDMIPRNGTNVELYFELQVQLDDGTPGYGNFSSDSAKCGEGTWKIPTLAIYWGCLIEGTKIRMADGSLKKIEDFKGDGTEKVISSRKGDIRTVTATTTGTENLPCVVFKNSNKQRLMLTQDHPVVTKNRGVILAKYLKKGDTVQTENGDTKIVEVTLKKYSGRIWNLELGTLKEAAKNKTTMFADGFLVGDNSMQQYYCRKDTEIKRTAPLKVLPAEWQKEYKNFSAPVKKKAKVKAKAKKVSK